MKSLLIKFCLFNLLLIFWYSTNPQNKIFQPFFTTKPTGQGTGLGLSLACNNITKLHSGTIKVESKEGEETKFIIQIPANKN